MPVTDILHQIPITYEYLRHGLLPLAINNQTFPRKSLTQLELCAIRVFAKQPTQSVLHLHPNPPNTLHSYKRVPDKILWLVSEASPQQKLGHLPVLHKPVKGII